MYIDITFKSVHLLHYNGMLYALGALLLYKITLHVLHWCVHLSYSYITSMSRISLLLHKIKGEA